MESKSEEKKPPISPEMIKLQHDLTEYYKHHFNLKDVFEVISRETFTTREFGFDRLAGGFTRNKSFEQPEHLKEYLSTFPVAGAYIGSLYESRLLPEERKFIAKTIHNVPWVGRELIFDFDMDEYDLVRTCDCTGRDVCEDCWFLMQQASVMIDETLREDFGFTKIRWLYTGGRGYHAWVLDEKGFTLDQDQRAAIIGHMQLIHDPKGMQKIDDIGNHADELRKRIYVKLGKKFIMNENNDSLLKEVGFTKHRLGLAREALKLTNLYKDIVDELPKNKEKEFLKQLVKYRYPRIDHKVSIDVRRLIRMPGSIHIRSKNICSFVDDPSTFNPIHDAVNMYDILLD